MLSILLHVDVQRTRLSQRKLDVVNDLILVADVVDGDLVRSADTHTLDGKASAFVSNCIVTSTGRLVDGGDRGADDVFTTCHHLTVEARGGDLCHHG